MTVPTKLQFKHQRGEGKVLAYFDLTYGDFVMRGFRVMRPARGGEPFVGYPSRQRGGDNEWQSLVFLPDEGRRKAFEAFVLKLYASDVREQRAAQACETAS